jgi:hypothetical protein
MTVPDPGLTSATRSAWETFKPSVRSSQRIPGTVQRKFSWAVGVTKRRTSRGTSVARLASEGVNIRSVSRAPHSRRSRSGPALGTGAAPLVERLGQSHSNLSSGAKSSIVRASR